MICRYRLPSVVYLTIHYNTCPINGRHPETEVILRRRLNLILARRLHKRVNNTA
jgi:hypothetical protein